MIKGNLDDAAFKKMFYADTRPLIPDEKPAIPALPPQAPALQPVQTNVDEVQKSTTNKQRQLPPCANGLPASKLNILQKLIIARARFFESSPKKSGKNIGSKYTYMYFELEDIIPVTTKIFADIGLLFTVNIMTDYAEGILYNTDNPLDALKFVTPYPQETSAQHIAPIQALGATHTYLRRYLYLLLMDVAELDYVDSNANAESTADAEVAKAKPKPAVPVPTMPIQQEERNDIKKALTAADAPVDENRRFALKRAYATLYRLDEAQKTPINEFLAKTNDLKKLSNRECENLMIEVSDKIASIKNTQPNAPVADTTATTNTTTATTNTTTTNTTTTSQEESK
jgi:hypothetical protein